MTRDHKYMYQEALRDTLQNPCYVQYVTQNPTADHTLCRIVPLQSWKIWRWGEYLVEEKWRQPYLEVTYEDIKKAIDYFNKAYHNPTGTITCRL
ncbi:hypothetical protein GCM10023187_23700 [Nibrella viscosa]|uniref:Uncharacterized protein n=1 Tax=Nibrella viscosa TaxID=1084524 RepID=A0ABP8KFT8_9BACT